MSESPLGIEPDVPRFASVVIDAPVLTADVLRRALLTSKAALTPFGLKVTGAAISGTLDVSGSDLPFPIEFTNCHFENEIRVEGAHLHSLAITAGSRLPGLLANGCRIDRDLDLSGTTVFGAHSRPASTSKTAAIWLAEAAVGGRFLCIGTTIETNADRAIQADHARFGGNLRFIDGFTSNGELRLLAVQADASIDFAGVTLRPRTGRAVDLSEANVLGSVFVIDDNNDRKSDVHGRIELDNAHIGGRLHLRHATLVAPGGKLGGHHYLPHDANDSEVCLWAPRLRVDGDVVVEGDTKIAGTLHLPTAEINGSLRISGASIESRGTALNLVNAAIRGDMVISSSSATSNLAVVGSIELAGAVVGGDLCFDFLHLAPAPVSTRGSSDDHPTLISAPGVRVGRDLKLRRVRTDGGSLWFGSADIGGDVDLAGAHLRCPAGHTASFHQASVGGTVRLTTFVDGVSREPFYSEGLLAFNQTRVGGRLLATGAQLSWREQPNLVFNRLGSAIEAIGARVEFGMILDWGHIEGCADFSRAQTSYIADRAASWGSAIRIAGFRYTRFAPLPGDMADSLGDWSLPARIGWLKRQVVADSEAWAYAATVFRLQGLAREADDLLIAGRRHARRTQQNTGPREVVRTLKDWLHEKFFGYGYRPGRAVVSLAALLAVTVLVAIASYRGGILRASDAAGAVYSYAGIHVTNEQVDTTQSAGAPLVPNSASRCGDGRVTCFQPFLFAIDTVVPIIDLRQRADWRPETATASGKLAQWWLSIATILGWALSSIAAISFTRLGRSSEE